MAFPHEVEISSRATEHYEPTLFSVMSVELIVDCRRSVTERSVVI